MYTHYILHYHVKFQNFLNAPRIYTEIPHVATPLRHTAVKQ